VIVNVRVCIWVRLMGELTLLGTSVPQYDRRRREMLRESGEARVLRTTHCHHHLASKVVVHIEDLRPA
jgi:hypothetical protein